jgi:hypothetical protein
LRLTFDRFPGLQIKTGIPCPGHDGQPCPHEFDVANLFRALERQPPKLEIECPVALENVSVTGLLYGIHPRTQDQVLEELARHTKEIAAGQKELLELVQRGFTRQVQLEQANVDMECPNVFILTNAGRSVGGDNLELTLFCQAPGEWHSEGDPYKFEKPDEWLAGIAPYVGGLVKVLKFLPPAALFKGALDNMAEITQNVESRSMRARGVAARDFLDLDPAEGSSLRALRYLLEQLDPPRQWRGLSKIITPEGHILWLCERQAKAYRR